MGQIAYEWIRSSRKTVSIQITEDGRVVVRSPYRTPRKRIEELLREKQDWICKKRQQLEIEKEHQIIITEEMRRQGKKEAKKKIRGRTEYYAGIMGVSYGRIAVKEQKTRWGSCSARGNLNFNWKLILMPEEILDYVVVHELAHRKELNHSSAFWAVVESVLPDYKERRHWLKTVGRRYQN